MRVLRWGQSAYETDADLALERDAAHALGWSWSAHPDPRSVPDLRSTDILVVTSKVRLAATSIDGTPVHTVLTTTSGTDHLDVTGLAARGIAVGRCPLARRDAVVEHALAAILALGKAWPAQLEAARRGRWCRSALPSLAPLGLADRPILVVGLGVIGTRMAEVLHALGARVLGVDPRGVPDGVDAVDLETGLARCAAVTLHCSLNPSTVDLLDARRLALLQPEAVVVNTARGRSLDVSAAVDAVVAGRLRGVAVDVFPQEPWPHLAHHGAHPAVWLTPHGAGYRPDLGARIAREVANALHCIDAGRPLPHPVLPPSTSVLG